MAPVTPVQRAEPIELVRSRVFEQDPEFRAFGRAASQISYGEATAPAPEADGSPAAGAGATNYLFAAHDDPHEPDPTFSRLRWGGQFVYCARTRRAVRETARRFTERGFEIVAGPTSIRRPFLGMSLPLLSRKTHYCVARKVRLTLPKEISERFTYNVKLVHDYRGPGAPDHSDGAHGGYVVLKEVPSPERVMARLRHKFPDATDELIEKRARKFTEKIFPLFLTREAAMLKILERDLPKEYATRVPRALHLEQDDKGYVRRMWMNWLRARTPGDQPLTQLEFARQAVDLLRVMHDTVGVIHLDLRLDNIVITQAGVGFVDFGSAVRQGEDIHGNPLLATIFDELMRTSQIQRMLEKMTSDGLVTSQILNDAHGKVDKGVDLFYLALQINNPLTNPDFRGLVKVDPSSDEALGIADVTQDVLKPRDASNPTIKSARDLLRALEVLGFALKGRGLRR